MLSSHAYHAIMLLFSTNLFFYTDKMSHFPIVLKHDRNRNIFLRWSLYMAKIKSSVKANTPFLQPQKMAEVVK